MIDWAALVVAPCVSTFGEPVIYKPAIGAPFPINGVFDNAYKESTMSEYGTEIHTYFPQLGVKLSDFPTPPAQGDQLTILSTGKTYAVRDPQPDSHGGARLVLNYVSG